MLSIYIYLLVVLLSFITSTFNWKNHGREDIILSTLLILTFISETISVILALVYHNNMAVFHFFNPMQFLLISLYYNYRITVFKKNNIGIYIGVLGVLLSILNSIFLQAMNEFINYFLLLEGLLIIGMTLQFFLEVVREDNFVLFKNKYLWISVIFLFFWSVTYTNWALTNTFSEFDSASRHAIFFGMWLVNIITYGGLSVIFILNKKKVLHNEY